MEYDIIVVGGGHAGIEASLAAARTNKKTLLISGNINNIADMPCNPSIGGPAKGILVREIDALGGEMGKAADKTLLQMKMLNSSKGPAVRALRAQSDNIKYPEYMRNIVFNTENLTVLESLVDAIEVKDGKVCSVIVEKNYVKGDNSQVDDRKEIITETLETKAIIIASGTYLDSRVLV